MATIKNTSAAGGAHHSLPYTP